MEEIYMKKSFSGRRILSILLSLAMLLLLAVVPATPVSAAGSGQNLKDGSYTLTGEMVKVDKKSYSMSNDAIDHTIHLKVSGGAYRLTMTFTGLTLPFGGRNMHGYLSNLKYYQTGYTLDTYGNPVGSLANTTVDSYITNSDGSRVQDTYGTNYPKNISFDLIPEAKNDGYVPLQVFVPIMESIATGNGTQNVFLRLDWSTLKTSSAFTDVSSDKYYYDAVNWAVQKGITSGTSANTFSPNASCTRGQMVQFLYKMSGSPAVSGNLAFTDVSSTAYYRNAVIWASQKGITGGTSANTFSPNASCTRGQMVQFLYKMNGSPAVSGRLAFADVSSTAYYRNAVIWASQKGITGGTSANTFSPNTSCTRGQMAVFLYKMS